MIELSLQPITKNEDSNSHLYASSQCKDLLHMYENYYQEIGFILPWVGYFIILDQTVVGSCGFTGPPIDGKVEIAYWTFKDYEKRGIATQVCGKLVEIALSENPSLGVVAKTAPEHNPSTKVLEKNGFSFTRLVQDHEIGDAWEWTLKKKG